MINEFESQTAAKKSPARSIEEQLALDLAKYLDRFPNKSFAIRILSKECGLHEKTIKRLLNQQNKPTYQTLATLYFIFLETENYQKMLESCPKVVRKYLESYVPAENITKPKQIDHLLSLFKKEPFLAEIFILAGTGWLELKKVEKQYGQYGLDAVKKMESEKIFIETAKGKYSLSPAVSALDGEILKFLGEYFVHKFSKPREVMSENSISFYAEGLNDQGFKEWLAIDTEAFYKKMKIANDKKFQGANPVFTFCATDSIFKEQS